QALPRRGRRAPRGLLRHAAVEAAAGARLDLACGGFVSLSRADARSPGDANGLLPPHRIRVRGRGVMAAAARGGRAEPTPSDAEAGQTMVGLIPKGTRPCRARLSNSFRHSD